MIAMLKHKILFFFIFFFIFQTNICLKARVPRRKIKIVGSQFSFINRQANQIYTYDSLALHPYFMTLNRLAHDRDGKVTILHIGDSHIQAGFLSEKIRNLFQQTDSYGNAGIGLVFPYSILKTNSFLPCKISFGGQWNGCKNISRNRKCHWGIMGAVAYTQDPQAWIQINVVEPQAAFRKLRFLGRNLNGPLGINVQIPGTDAPIQRYENSQEGYIDFFFDTPQTQARIVFSSIFPFTNGHYALQGICLENLQAGVVYSSMGINGAQAGSYLKCPDLGENIRALRPDLIIISLGTNEAHDAKFSKQNYFLQMGRLLQRIRMAAPNACLLLTTPADSYRRRRYPNPNNAKAAGVLYKLAMQADAAVWDFYTIMGGYKSIRKWKKANLCQSDRLHFTKQGYDLQGSLLFQALNKAYLSWLLGQPLSYPTPPKEEIE